jgi:porin
MRIPLPRLLLTGRRLCAVIAACLPAFVASARGRPVHSALEESQVPDFGAVELESDSTETRCSIAATWDKLRKSAETRGVSVSVIYDGEGLVNVSGGARTGAAYVGNLHLQLTVDGERLLGWNGATLFVNGLGTHGGHPSSLVGDAQGVSNLEAPAGWQLYEAWVQQNLFENRGSVLVGRYDLNSEFYRLQSASLFLNSSFGMGPEFSQSGSGGPSIFPDTSVGVRLGFKPARGIVIRAAILDGSPVDRPDGGHGVFEQGDGLLWVGEAAFLSRPNPEDRPLGQRFRIGRGAGLSPYDSKVAVGGWYYTAEFADLSERDPDGRPIRHRGSGGAYLLADELLHRSDSSPKQISAFAQLGFGDSRVNRFGFYAGGGLVFSGLFPTLENDELGLAVAIARNGSHFIDLQRTNGNPVTGTETTVELTYLLQAGKHAALQPDLQYVMRPGTDPARKNALAVGLRFEIAY